MKDMLSGFRRDHRRPLEETDEEDTGAQKHSSEWREGHAAIPSSAEEAVELALAASSRSTSNNKARPPVGFLKLAKHQRFAEILDVLNREEEYNVEGWLFMVEEEPKKKRFSLLRGGNQNHNLHLFRGETPLHVILHYHPTVAVVDKLIDFLASSRKSQAVPEDALDMLGRTPLHVGASKGCSSSVMSRLVSGVSVVMPAVAKDSSGRFALHWACANPSGEDATASCSRTQRRGLKKNNDGISAVDNMVQVVFLLLKAYPEASTIPDDDGNTPLDLARSHGADPRILQLVEDSYESCKKARGAKSNGKPKYKDLRDHFKETSITEASSDDDVPQEVSEHDYDDVSSIGSAGVSLYAKKKIKDSGKPWSLQVQRIEEAIEL